MGNMMRRRPRRSPESAGEAASAAPAITSDEAAFLMRLSPEARRAAAELGTRQDEQGRRVMGEITRLLLGAELDAAMSAAAAAIDPDCTGSVEDEAGIEEAAVKLSALRR